MRIAPLLVTALAFAAAGQARATVAEADRLEALDRALSRWDVTSATWEAERLLAQHPDDPLALLAAARVAFHAADYERARDLAERASKLPGIAVEDAEAAQQLVGYLEERAATWKDFAEHRSTHFLLRVTPRDELLVPYALQALEDSAKALEDVLDFCPTEPVVVEIFPNRRSFIAASSLTREEVETSGTVALCHFNRIMIMSPAVMARGYDWLDTLCHEYVHYATYHVGEDAVPVWLHEGVARTLQASWRGVPVDALDPHASTLLAEAREAGTWVSFADMHPSMAKLPSATLVSLAFAEVAVAATTILEEGGPARLQALLAALRASDGDVDGALRAAGLGGLDPFERRVRQRVARMDLYRIEGASFLEGTTKDPEAPQFLDEGDKAPTPEEEARQLADRRARDWAILGDRLKGREMFEAAVIEYDKALAQVGRSEPLLVNRKAHALLLAGRPAEALPVLQQVERDFPGLTSTLDNLSECHVRLAAVESDPARRRAHVDAALRSAQASERINPYNVDTHVRLASLLDRLGRKVEADRARERLHQLRQASR